MAEPQTIGDVDAAKSWLLQNKNGVAAFDQKYGKGSALAVLKELTRLRQTQKVHLYLKRLVIL